MRLVRGVALWMLAPILAVLIFGGPPPTIEIMGGTVVLVFVGLLAISSAEDRRVERLRPVNPAVEDLPAKISPDPAGTDGPLDPSSPLHERQ
jgi:hypothetical protein